MKERSQPKLSFHFVALEDTFNEAVLLSEKNVCQALDTPVKIIKKNRNLMTYFILHNFNNAYSNSECPAKLKYANITPLFKKDDKTDKTNY